MIGYQLAIQAAHRPSQLALCYGAQRLSYAQLHANAGRLANALAADGIQPGDRVAVLLHNCTAFLETLFACALLGAVFVPINFRLVGREVGLVIDACAPRVLLAGESFATMLAQIRTEVDAPILRWVDDRPPDSAAGHDDDYARWRDAHGTEAPREPVSSDAILMLLHSSGTTGLPKGIMHSHATTLASSSAKIIDLSLTPDDTTVVFGPLFHAGPLMDLTLPLLMRGGRVVLGVSRHFEPQQLLQAIG
jgi:fatty-acyl-CoA synthase